MTSLSGQRVVIFGCGYVGGALAHAAIARGMKVTALTRNAARAAELRAAGVETIVADLTSPAWHDQVPSDANFAALTVSASESTEAGYRRAYVDGSRSVLAWAGGRGRAIDTLVYTSSTGVYPQGDGAIVDESAPTAAAQATGRVLVEAEGLLRSAPESLIRRVFILRLAGIYGPGRHQLLDALRAGAAELPGDPAVHLNLIHRDDVVSAMLACFGAGAEIDGQTFNLSDNAPAKRAEFVGWLAARLGRPAPALTGVARGGGRRGGAPVPDRVIRGERIRQVLGWTPRHADFRSGYRAILGEV